MGWLPAFVDMTSQDGFRLAEPIGFVATVAGHDGFRLAKPILRRASAPSPVESGLG